MVPTATCRCKRHIENKSAFPTTRRAANLWFHTRPIYGFSDKTARFFRAHDTRGGFISCISFTLRALCRTLLRSIYGPNGRPSLIGASSLGNRRAHARGTSPKPFQAGPRPCSCSPRPQDTTGVDPKRPQSHRFTSGQEGTCSLCFLGQRERCARVTAIVRLHSTEPLRQVLNHFHVVVPAVGFIV
jgi:hypothetical protein